MTNLTMDSPTTLNGFKSLTNPTAILEVKIDGRTYSKKVVVPDEYLAEANRRMDSPATPDGLRHCLNRCCLPFYQWVRENTQTLYNETIVEHKRKFLMEHPGVDDVKFTPFEDAMEVHPHMQTAPHWFENQL